jgi:hypothetical protein
MTDEILQKMRRGVYYPGNHLGNKTKLEGLERVTWNAWMGPIYVVRTARQIIA